jgi:hypothetical protein
MKVLLPGGQTVSEKKSQHITPFLFSSAADERTLY